MNITMMYTFISVMIAVIDVIIACLAFSKKDMPGKNLGVACILAMVVDCAYLVTINTSDYFINSIFSSIYFAGISFMLNALIAFVLSFTKTHRSKMGRNMLAISLTYMVFDIIIFAINPFKEIVVGYSFRGGALSQFSFDMKPLFIMHLLYSYLLVASVLFILIMAAIRLAREYRRQYIICILALSIIVAINAVFLFVPNMGIISRIDVSVLLYSVAAIFFYWACFVFPKYWLHGILKASIFDSLDLGIILFGQDDKMIFHNHKVKKFIPHLNFQEGLTLDEFITKSDINYNRELAEDDYSFQWHREIESGEGHPFFCEYKRLKNEQDRNLGRLFIFEDGILESDSLTGFHNLEPFSTLPNMSHFEYPVVVSCCDINGLSIINSTKGRAAGDKLISELAEGFRKEFPAGTYFIRGTDANLIAISNNAKEEDVMGIMEKVRANFSGTFQYSTIVVTQEEENIVEGIQKAESNVATWKLMDKNSLRSDKLTSLISALKECDPETEAHVYRTQKMAIELSRKLRLTDTDEVHLALLCVLHDIGKLAVPLGILHKKGSLTDDEWELMKTHVEKGYEIAMSSVNYIPIARAIRHHHERWDGKGYPDGLSKETIPFLSRIISVIDAYDAMISVRPYHEPLSKQQAMGELQKKAGTQFDPKIVSEFIHLFSEDGKGFDADIFNAKPDSEEDDKRPGSNQKNNTVKMDAEAEEVTTISYVKYSLDKDYHVIEHDEAFNKLTGYTDEDIEKLHLTQGDLVPERSKLQFFTMVFEQLRRNQSAYFEFILLKKDGTEIPVFCLAKYFYHSATKKEEYNVLLLEVTRTNAASMIYRDEKKRAENRLEVWEDTFRRDSLTGLFNHSAFVNEVELKLLDKAFRTVLLMMDVDDFKNYNDTYGHRNGDEFLVATAEAIQDSLREADISGRLGGDEFAAAIFFPKEVSEAAIRNRVEETFKVISRKIRTAKNSTTVSMGAAVSGEEINNFTDLYDAADAALYRSKAEGRNCINW